MATILKAIRSGKKIIVDYKIERAEIEEKLYLCIMNNQGSVTSRPLKMKPGKDRLSFNFGDDSNKYRKVYIGDSDKKIIGSSVTIPETMDREQLKKLFLECILPPILFILFIIIVIKFTIIKNTELASFKIHKALQQGLNKIQVQGEIKLYQDIAPSIAFTIYSATKIELWEGNKLLQSKTLANFAPSAQQFYVEWENKYSHEKQYTIQCTYKDKPLLDKPIIVQLDKAYPIAHLEECNFTSDKQVDIKINTQFIGDAQLYIQTMPENFSEFTVKKPLQNQQGRQHTRLGPMSVYSPFYKVQLYAQFSDKQSLLDEQKIPCTFSSATIITAQFSSLDTVLCSGKWDGPDSHASSIVCEIFDESTKQSVASQSLSDKQFLIYQKVPTYHNNYKARILYDSEILASKNIVSTIELLQFIDLRDKMIYFAPTIDNVVQKMASEGLQENIRTEILQLSNYSKESAEKIKRLFFQFSDQIKSQQIQKYYHNIHQFFHFILQEHDTIAQKDQKNIWKIICNTKIQELSRIFNQIENMLLHIHPQAQNKFPFIKSTIEEARLQQKMQTYLDNIYSCVQEGQLILAIDICTQCLQIYNDHWEFLYARYHIYKALANKKSYTDEEAMYKKYAKQDQEKLVQQLNVEFQKQILILNYPQAYLLGLYLEQIQENSANLQRQMKDILGKITLEQKIEAYQKSLKIKFTYENI
ncbi:MAG TPA: hypothetical protein PLB63_08490 [Planctomycetota bacterium]|nr:hypothetical protein [Planctomycetota bacterium]HQB00863.1 hypothetical protein [Planctomycetota bacterium]